MTKTDNRFRYFAMGFLLAGVIALLLMLRNCDGKTTVPAVSGTLTDTIHEVKYDTIKLKGREKIVYKTIVQELRITDTLNTTDTTYVYKPIDTLRTQSFEKPFEDEHLKATVKGVVTGRIEGVMVDYTIKERKVPVSKPSRFSVGITGGVDYKGQPSIVGGVQYRLFGL